MKAGLLKLLETEYPKETYKYYSMAVVENYERPCFFTQLLPVDMRPENYNSRKNEVVFYITILLEKADEARMLDMIQHIRDLFGLNVMVRDKSVNVTDFDWNYTGKDRNIPEIAVSLMWFDRIEHKNSAPVVEQVVTNNELEE